MVTMTITEARKRARAQLRFGWYRRDASSGWVHCPSCREQVGAEWFPWAKPGEIAAALREALAEHLRDDCRAA